ncbi:hypothetical protein HDV06_004023 [Boothiomyces sp. JEL0866]|nr:hypothetical protein HDV06_004023 [Boothiomyces sp. JEL0866]
MFPLSAILRGGWYGLMFIFDFLPIVFYSSKVIQVYRVHWKVSKSKSTLLRFMFDKAWKVLLYFVVQLLNTLAYGAINDIQYYTDYLGGDQAYIAMASFKNFILTVHRILLLLCLEELKIITLKLTLPISEKSTSKNNNTRGQFAANNYNNINTLVTKQASSLKWTLT